MEKKDKDKEVDELRLVQFKLKTKIFKLFRKKLIDEDKDAQQVLSDLVSKYVGNASK